MPYNSPTDSLDNTSMAFSIFTVLNDHHHNQFQNIGLFKTRKKSLIPNSHTHFLPTHPFSPCQPLSTSVFLDLLALNIKHFLSESCTM
jgi:hypothetical protein